jgi:hypothetical protein
MPWPSDASLLGDVSLGVFAVCVGAQSGGLVGWFLVGVGVVLGAGRVVAALVHRLRRAPRVDEPSPRA